jgi:hypothetical protein
MPSPDGIPLYCCIRNRIAEVSQFWAIRVIGFSVVLPMVPILERRFGVFRGEDPFAPENRSRSDVDGRTNTGEDVLDAQAPGRQRRDR